MFEDHKIREKKH